MVRDILTAVVLDPTINFLVILDQALLGSFGLAIIAFAVVVRLAPCPLPFGSFTPAARSRFFSEMASKSADPSVTVKRNPRISTARAGLTRWPSLFRQRSYKSPS